MSLRTIQIFMPSEYGDRVMEAITEHESITVWRDRLSEGRCLINVLLRTGATEALLDDLDRKFSTVPDFRVLLLRVEATLPRPKTQLMDTPKPRTIVGRLSREELYADVDASVQPSLTFFTFIILSAVVAAIGLLRDNTAIIIGAMVIAPLLGPNVALALSTTLADGDLGRRALRTLILGLIVTLIFAAAMAFLLPVSEEALHTHEMVSRTEVAYSDIVLALAAGAAATLSVTTGASGALIGVMVAVALMPPAVTLGMLLGLARWKEAAGALLLLLTNLICVNLAGVITFVAQGVRPRTWWQADRARMAARKALAIWSALLVVLWLLIRLSHR